MKAIHLAALILALQSETYVETGPQIVLK